MKRIAALCFFLLGCACVVPGEAADPERGRSIYEARCSLCHTTSVHARDPRKAQDFEGIREQVRRWSGEVGGGWSREDIDDVTVYLNRRYYRFDCPALLCGGGQARLDR